MVEPKKIIDIMMNNKINWNTLDKIYLPLDVKERRRKN